MIFLDIWRHVLSTVAHLGLALSLSLAHLVAPPFPSPSAPISTVTTLPDETPDVPSALKILSDTIRTQLHTDTRFQQATVLTAPPLSPHRGTTTALESALANIFCTFHDGNTERTVSGSGVFVHPEGVMLTNAHIAQFLLLADTSTTRVPCIIRRGNPTATTYIAELLYISPTWITKNAHQLSSHTPTGTGEYDFALVRAIHPTVSEEVFPSVPLSANTYLFHPMEVTAAGYPAELLTPDTIDTPLIPKVATTTITRLFTFSADLVDLIAIAPSEVGKQGSSGGPILDENGVLIGIITTRGDATQEHRHSLRALTLPYIDRTLQEETGLDLAHMLAGDIPLRASVFRDTVIPHLKQLLLKPSATTP